MKGDFYVLCEGIHDRDFLAGWFEKARNWQDPSDRGRRTVLPLFAGEQLPKGMFVFVKGDCRVGLVPFGGRDELSSRFTAWLGESRSLGTLGYSGLIVVADRDCGPGNVDPVADLARTAMQSAGWQVPPGPPWPLGNLHVDFVSIGTGVIEIDGLPAQECLERVVIAAFARAHPARHKALCDWLRSRPEATGPEAKATSWSIMSSWFADSGCTDFLRRAIWDDDRIRAQLIATLQATRLPQVTALLEAG